MDTDVSEDRDERRDGALRTLSVVVRGGPGGGGPKDQGPGTYCISGIL